MVERLRDREWVAGRRVMRMGSRTGVRQIVLGQGSMALGAVIWGTGAASAGLDLTFAGAAGITLAALALGHRFSINFATEARVDAAPLNHLHYLPVVPDDDDGPVTITIEYAIPSDDREKFRILMQEVQATFRRNGAFQCRLDESLDRRGLFRLEYLVSTWAEHLPWNMRMTVDETRVFKKVWNLHAGDSDRSCVLSSRHRNSFTSARFWLAAPLPIHRECRSRDWWLSPLTLDRFRCGHFHSVRDGKEISLDLVCTAKPRVLPPMARERAVGHVRLRPGYGRDLVDA